MGGEIFLWWMESVASTLLKLGVVLIWGAEKCAGWVLLRVEVVVRSTSVESFSRD